MAIAFDDAGSATTASDTALSITDLTISGSNRYLAVGVSFDDTVDHSVTGTWNGNPLTVRLNNTAKRGLVVLDLVAPDTGTQTLALSWSTAGRATAIAVSYTGVDQTTATDGWSATTGTSATASRDTASAAGDLVVDFVVFNGGTALSVGADQTSRAESDNGGQLQSGCSEEAGAGTVTSSWGSGFEDWAIATANLNAAAGGGGSPTVASARFRNLRVRAS